MGKDDNKNKRIEKFDNFIINKLEKELLDKLTLANMYHNQSLIDITHNFLSKLYTICLFDNHVRVLNFCTCFYLFLLEENNRFHIEITKIEADLDKLRSENSDLNLFLDSLKCASLYDIESTKNLLSILSKS